MGFGSAEGEACLSTGGHSSQVRVYVYVVMPEHEISNYIHRSNLSEILLGRLVHSGSAGGEIPFPGIIVQDGLAFLRRQSGCKL